MVKPKKERPVQRRLTTISLYVATWVLLTLLAPVWLVAGIAIGVVRRRSFVTLRLLLFSWFFFGIAMVALVRLAAAFTFLGGNQDELQARLLRLQQWWARAVLRDASKLLELDIQIEDADVALPGPTILLMARQHPRHASPERLRPRPHSMACSVHIEAGTSFRPLPRHRRKRTSELLRRPHWGSPA